MYCRFENHLTQHALELTGLVHKLYAYCAADLPQVWQQLEQAHQQGLWAALVANYELGAHILDLPWAAPSSQPLLSIYLFSSATPTQPWSAPTQTVALHAHALGRKNDYLEHLHQIQAGIKEGNFYQVNYSLPLAVESTASPLALYQHLATRHPVPYAAYIADESRHILSFSPELFVERTGSTLRVKPMKGTMARHVDPALDQHAAHQLRNSAKDVAENIMIVDLLRNDLGKIAQTGTVKVTRLLDVEAYPSVWTMTSTIQAQTENHSVAQLLQALFPCGSITGTPKIASMRCIHELEQRDRGVYCGSIGWLAPNGDLQLNVAIRTIEYQDDHTAQFGVGGAIVIDSDPEKEWQECLWKARVLGTPISFDE
ncbi:aminodeoxychorismate synthase component I [Paenalcaligenes hominis]|uniref:aminodeoxychorismate synthase component I n=1 Tax=Paenalcaligenes hominis TaxID=643674 RepID=UPI003523F1A0